MSGCARGGSSWFAEDEKFRELCTDSQFTREGSYLAGPSPRDMHRLPAEVRDGMLWLEARIIYGADHP